MKEGALEYSTAASEAEADESPNLVFTLRARRERARNVSAGETALDRSLAAADNVRWLKRNGRQVMPIILVVDDSPVDRLLTGRLLSREKELDWVIEYAENGREALAFMKDLVPHVVVTDLMMPDMDGLELVAAVRAEHPEVPVILMTGQGSETLALEALERGAASYVPKGQLADKLLDTVK